MFKRTLPRSLLVLAGVAISGSALAQSNACQRYRAELASLGSGGGGGFEAAAQRQRYEISRLGGYYQSLGCERGGFFMFGEPPAECGAIAQRIRLMQATYNQLAARADSGASPARRNQLVAAIREACSPQRVAALQEPSRSPERDYAEQRRARVKLLEEKRKAPTGGGRIVCVKTCDGSFFPLSNTPDGRGGADGMCKALCPGAETVAYSMPVEGEIEEAVSLNKRQPYVRLAAAFKFQKTVDPSCACRKDGETWAQALQRAEKMLDRHKGDIIVTAQKAEELSRPKSIRVANRKGKPAEPGPRETYASIKPEPAPPAAEAKTEVSPAVASRVAVQKSDAKAEVDVESTGSLKVPTASKASSGIGEQIAEAKPLPQGDGPKVELKEGDGAVRKVRIVAPGVIPVPKVEAP